MENTMVMRTLVKASIPWNVKQIAKMVKNRSIVFDNIIQRGYVWELERKSQLITSLIMNYPVPPIYTAKTDGVYDVMDGQQRIKTVVSFLDDEFALTGNLPFRLRMDRW